MDFGGLDAVSWPAILLTAIVIVRIALHDRIDR